ncbi:MAG: transcription antitermination factor NusB [Lachnospiraceae bacterium]|nr:transcription antitermination factor NusB [Lachnospiraceae bacterium]MBQ5361576.1 transcription antitermination factor NusB [Lachnospiraceae bacterium]
MNRRSLREQVFKLLFRAEFNTPEEMPEQEKFFFESGDFVATPEDQAKISEKCTKILAMIPELDQEISEKLEGWKIGRLGKVELAILRLALYEIRYDDDVPTGAAINEAVELAKKFGQDNSGQFINGILAKFARQ